MDTEVGYVTSSRDFLVYLDGLPSIRINDMVESDSGIKGLVASLSENAVEILMLDEANVYPGQMFKKLPGRLGIETGDFLLGRAINPLGIPIDGRGPLSKSKQNPSVSLDQPAPGIGARQFITEQFQTGITLVDSIIPIGLGQRELIIGDAHSGKTSFLIDLMVNQKDKGTICIYASVGKPAVTVRDMLDILRANNALSYSVIIAASSSEISPLIFLTPKTAFSIAEYFQKKGKDVLLILDDLGIHAKVYREMALLSNKSPGRESYPGDIFYQHAHLLERAGNFKKEAGGGSITALPVIELNLADFTTFIPTNLMAMTDGHLLFKASLHNLGQRPAIDISLSVSRVGRQTQSLIQSLISDRIRQLLSAAFELETISKFSSELPFQTRLILNQKQLTDEALKQDPLTYTNLEIQLILLGLVFTTFLTEKSRAFFEKNKKLMVEAFLSDPKLSKITKIVPKLKSDTELIKILEEAKPVLETLFK